MVHTSNQQALSGIAFESSFAQLPEQFFAIVKPTKVASPKWIQLNTPLTEELGLDPAVLKSDAGLNLFSGNETAEQSVPISMAYAGHQFGGWVPQLGDGRAILLGELIDANGHRRDIQLKGAGRTPFSRGGDGRNWVGPVLREYLISEAMAALGVPTTRALAAVSTGESVLRENGPVPGAILTRVAHSHIRVGSFQYFAARQNISAIDTLMNYVINRHYPELADSSEKALNFLKAILHKQALLIAHWQSIGFIHGVMNTDNCSIIGHTIDYGPCAFMDTYRADKVFSSIDRGSRYAYQNQPRMAQWNLANLAQCLLPLIDEDQEEALVLAQNTINSFDEVYSGYYLKLMRAKLGLNNTHSDDAELIRQLLSQMQAHELDFTVTFSDLCDHENSTLFTPDGALYDWSQQWLKRLSLSNITIEKAKSLMHRANPIIIPRNHQVEAFISDAVNRDDFQAFETMLKAVKTPFENHHKNGKFTRPPSEDELVTQTFCGT